MPLRLLAASRYPPTESHVRPISAATPSGSGRDAAVSPGPARAATPSAGVRVCVCVHSCVPWLEVFKACEREAAVCPGPLQAAIPAAGVCVCSYARV